MLHSFRTASAAYAACDPDPDTPVAGRLPTAVVDFARDDHCSPEIINDLDIMAYTSPDGKTYKDYQEYGNSDDLDTMEVFMKQEAGHRTPQNNKEYGGMSEHGEVIDFPMDTFIPIIYYKAITVYPVFKKLYQAWQSLTNEHILA